MCFLRFFILLATLIVLVQTQNIEIRCQYYLTSSVNYICNGSAVITQSDTRNVTIVSNHLWGYTNIRVIGVVFLDNLLEFLVPEIFTTFPNTRVLDVRGGLSNIENNTFKDAKNLETLNIFYSTLKVLPPFAFDGAEKLTSIHIYDCNIDEIDENAFQGMEQLTYLIISKSKLRYLPQNVFRPLNNLGALFLQDSSIESIPSSLFANNNMLKTLYLDNNSITEIERNFVDQNFLQFLYLANNICTNTTLRDVQKQWKEIDSDLEPCYRNYERTKDVCQQYCSLQCRN